MKILRSIILLTAITSISLSAVAQVESATTVRRRTAKDKKATTSSTQVTERMQSFYDAREPHDADLSYMREIYRQLDLSKDQNAPLYFPEDVVDGQENLFRIMLRLVVDGQIPAYEYLDGREVFTEKYQINVGEMLDRFGIYYTSSSSSRSAKYTIEEADVPTTQVLNYYIIEKWEFDKRSNKMKTRVEAICPVLNRYGDYGGEAKYPMFWVKFDALRPYLAQQYVFISDDNNLAQYSLDDYFNMGMYSGDIYKTKNLRNLSMAQMYPDPDDMKAAQDSIDKRLRSFGDNLWVPTREEYLAQLEAQEEAQAAQEEAEALAAAEADGTLTPGDRDEQTESTVTVVPAATSSRAGRTAKKTSSTTSSKKKKKTTKKPKYTSTSSSSSSEGNPSAEKSVRRRKR